MSEAISQTVIDALRRELEAHPIYGAIESLPQLRVFMQHHVYSVWDFMSLIKHLQNLVAPARVPWRRFSACMDSASPCPGIRPVGRN